MWSFVFRADYDRGMDHIAPLFIVGLASALLGWAMMVLSSRIEHDRQERHASQFGEHEPAAAAPLPSWVRLASSWLMLFVVNHDARR
jgi:hypothetical protein